MLMASTRVSVHGGCSKGRGGRCGCGASSGRGRSSSSPSNAVSTSCSFHVPWNVGAPDVAPLARLVEMAHARGLRTSALGGAPGWLDDPDGVVDR